MLIAFAIAAATLVGMALAPAYPVMLLAAGLAGLALATGNPVTNKLVAVHLPPGSRGLVMGGKQAGVQVGAFLAGALLAPLAAQAGWRAALGWARPGADRRPAARHGASSRGRDVGGDGVRASRSLRATCPAACDGWRSMPS